MVLGEQRAPQRTPGRPRGFTFLTAGKDQTHTPGKPEEITNNIKITTVTISYVVNVNIFSTKIITLWQ